MSEASVELAHQKRTTPRMVGTGLWETQPRQRTKRNDDSARPPATNSDANCLPSTLLSSTRGGDLRVPRRQLHHSFSVWHRRLEKLPR